MKLQDAKLTIDGQEVLIKNVEVSYTCEGAMPEVRVDGYFAPDYSFMEKPVTINTKTAEPFDAEKLAEDILKLGKWHYTGANTITIYDVDTKGIETIMCRDECAKECAVEDRSYGNVAKKVRDLKLSADDKLLRKYGIVYDDGQVTGQGKELLWELLFEDYKETIVEHLNELEAEDTEE